jgi:hypothetical protein
VRGRLVTELFALQLEPGLRIVQWNLLDSVGAALSACGPRGPRGASPWRDHSWCVYSPVSGARRTLEPNDARISCHSEPQPGQPVDLNGAPEYVSRGQC